MFDGLGAALIAVTERDTAHQTVLILKHVNRSSDRHTVLMLVSSRLWPFLVLCKQPSDHGTFLIIWFD